MSARGNNPSSGKRSVREYDFAPRIINPVKMHNAVIFSAEEQVRTAGKTLKDNIPWIEITVLSDPISASNYVGKGASVFLLDDTSMPFVDSQKIHHNNKDAVMVLLSTNDFIHRSPPSVAQGKYPYTANAELIFAVNKTEFLPEKIITSVVRCAEDLLNIEKYSRERRFIFLIVDDEPRWFSQFLPVLYEIIGQRADVRVTRTYEQTMKFLFGTEQEAEIDGKNYLTQGRGDDVVCIITDVFFPRGEDLQSDAGVDLIKLTNKYYPRIPIIIASKAKEADNLKDMAFILPKGDPGSLQTFKEYIYDFTGLGDFLVVGRTSEAQHRIKHIQEMYELLCQAEGNTPEAQELREGLENYARKDFFSTWLYMHGFRELGDELRPKQDTGRKLVAVLKRHMKREILRMEHTPLIIDGIKIFSLTDLMNVLQTVAPSQIQKFSDTDAFSTWLDRKCYPELAEEIRPIHGSGSKLRKTLADVVAKWTEIYRQKGRPV